MMTETQRAALMAAEDAFRRESDYYAMIGKETKARASMALAGQMAAALSEPEPDGDVLSAFAKYAMQFTYNSHPARPENFPKSYPWFEAGYNAGLSTAQRREPLTDEQIDYIYNEHCGDGGPTAICERFARAIEAAHGIGANP